MICDVELHYSESPLPAFYFEIIKCEHRILSERGRRQSKKELER